MNKRDYYRACLIGLLLLAGTWGCKDGDQELVPDPPKEEPTLDGGPIHNEIKNEGGYYRFYRNNEVFYIKGAAYNDFVDQVDDFGGNAIRTYSVNDVAATKKLLDDAFANNIAVMLGIWIQRPKDGFDYENAVAVKEQFDNIKQWVNQFKDHPALMMWALGNEVSSADPLLWQNVNEIGEMIKDVDPHHPVTTVLAGTNQAIIKVIMEKCPSFDLLGINSYEGAVSLVQGKLNEIGWDKPYMICETGQRGTWDTQVDFTSWGSTAGNGLIELTSTQKAEKYKQIVKEEVMAHYNKPITCLGSFVFLWGYQTRGDVITWYPMFNRFGAAMEAAHVMRYLWTSYNSPNKPPQIKSNGDFTINSKTVYDNLVTNTNAINSASILATDPEGDPLSFEWIVTEEGITFSRDDQTFKGSLPMAEGATIDSNNDMVTFKMANEGFYRLNCFVYDNNNNVAHASFPFKVDFSIDPDYTPKPVSLNSNLELGMQANANVAQFIDIETSNKYFFQGDPYGIDNANVVDFGFYWSSTNGLCIAAPADSDAAQFIYKGEKGFGNWQPRNVTQMVLAGASEFSLEDLMETTDDQAIHEAFHVGSSSSTIKKMNTDDIILFRTMDGNYGALRIKSWENSVSGKVIFDILAP